MNTKINSLFDAGSDRWIRILRCLSIVEFFLFILAGIGICIALMVVEEWIGALGALVGGCLVGFLQLVLSMLVIQLLNNVQAIRKKLEMKTEDNSDVKADIATAKPEELPEL